MELLNTPKTARREVAYGMIFLQNNINLIQIKAVRDGNSTRVRSTEPRFFWI